MIRIRSENPPGDERAIASFCAAELKKAGYKPRVFSYFPKRDNVLASLKTRKPACRILLSPHLDTVPAGNGWSVPPFSGVIRAGKVYGRGATDDKCNLAVALEVMRSLKEDGQRLNGEWIFLATADEETGSQKGLIPWLEKCGQMPDYALILDSDEGDIITAQKGLIHFKVEVSGRKAHGAYPHRGINAIERALQLVSALKKLKFDFTPHSLLRGPTINIGVIRGGEKVNMVPDWCEFEVDLRFLPGMNGVGAMSSVRSAFNSTGIPYKIKIHSLQKPYEISGSHPLVLDLRQAGSELGKKLEVKGSEGATVITFFREKGVPAVATGWGSRGGAHATDEYASIDNIFNGARQLERFVRIFDHRFDDRLRSK